MNNTDLTNRLADAINRFDVDAFTQLFDEAAAADRAAAQARIALVDAQPVPPRLVLRIPAKQVGKFVYVTRCAFKAGDGYQISRIHYGARAQAAIFGADAGLAIARQLAGGFALRGTTLETA
jgi:hypothetical protein